MKPHLVLAVLIGIFIVACSATEPTPNIDATVEARIATVLTKVPAETAVVLTKVPTETAVVLTKAPTETVVQTPTLADRNRDMMAAFSIGGSVTLVPTKISPGEDLEVRIGGTISVDNDSAYFSGSNFTVTFGTTRGGSEITLTGNSTFPIDVDGTGTGTITVPTTVTAGSYYVTVTDNAAEIGGSTAITNNTYTVSIVVPEGVITVSLAIASTGDTVTLTGSNFPPNTTASTLTIGGSNAMPPAGIVTDSDGRFAEVIEIPAATTGGSLSPGTQIISVKIGTITGIDGGFSTP